MAARILSGMSLENDETDSTSSFDIIDDGDRVDPDKRRLRQLRAERERLGRDAARRGRALMAAGAIALAIAALQCGFMAWQKHRTGNTAAAATFLLLTFVAIAVSVVLFRRWRRGPGM